MVRRREVSVRLFKDGYHNGFIEVVAEDEFKFYGFSYWDAHQIDRSEKFWIKHAHKWTMFDADIYINNVPSSERLKANMLMARKGIE